MFAAPPILETRLVGRVPAKFHVEGRNCDRYGMRKLYIEGPTIARDGTLYFTDIPAGRVFAMSPAGDVDLFVEYDGHPNGLKIHKDGRIFVADYKNGIMTIDPVSRRVEPFCVRIANERLRGPNDLAFALNGDLYFTDQGNSDYLRPHGRVARVPNGGRPELIMENLESPNGVVVSPDGESLYVSLTRTNNVLKASLDVPPGLEKTAFVGTTGVFVQMSGGVGPDGMAVDADGNLAVAHTGLGCVWLFSPLGEPLYRIQTCAGPSISNMVYGGPEGRTLFITESSTGSILTAEMPTPGAKLYALT